MTSAECKIAGHPISGGIAIGPAYVVEVGEIRVLESVLAGDRLEDEVQRFRQAVEKSRRQLGFLKQKTTALPDHAADDLSLLLDAHLGILSGSRLIRGVEACIREAAVNAESAVNRQIATLADAFAAMDDAYLSSRVEEIRAVGARLVRNLVDHPFEGFDTAPEGCIVVAEEIGPADLAQMDPTRLAGMAVVRGGTEAHAAIMARSLGLPSVMGAPGLMREVYSGQTLIVDGSGGLVIVNPTEETLADYRRRKQARIDAESALAKLERLPATTLDRVDIDLEANVDLPRDAPLALAVGAAGLGLVRTEYLTIGRLPDEDQQAEALTGIVRCMKGRPATIRTFDFGDDKDIWSAEDATDGETQRNPALGLRAIRLAAREPAILETQLAAILRAATAGPVRILVPMVTGIDQMEMVRQMLDQAAARLRRSGMACPDVLPPVGAMIEVPAAALMADRLARVSDFFAVGTNDLAMYTLAVDRGNPSVSELYEPLHPAVLRLIEISAAAAQKAGIPLSVCGEMAGDPELVPFLIGIGVRSVSMSPARLLHVKKAIRSIETGQAARLAERMLSASSAGEVRRILDETDLAESATNDDVAGRKADAPVDSFAG